MPNDLAIIERQLFALRPRFDQVLRPTGLTADRMMRTIIISCERNGDLLNCTVPSIMQSAMTGAVLGLEADGVTGQGFLVPFRVKGVPTAQWITGYKGQATLGWRAGFTITGDVVREGDDFDYMLGTGAYVHHKPKDDPERRITRAWAQAEAPNRSPIIVVMPIAEILQIKAKAPSSKKPDSPWNQPGVPFAAMCSKTARRRLGRSMPLSSFVLSARVDEAHEEQGRHSWIDPDKGVVIEGTASEEPPLAEGQPAAAPLTAARLDPPKFVIKGARGDIPFPTIEGWRARMETAIADIKTHEGLARFLELNALAMDDYRDNHPQEVDAVGLAFDRRKRQLG